MDLSVLIPARNEMFLKRTIDDVLANMRAETEVIAILDGAWAEPAIPDHPRVRLVYHGTSIGQRAATNEAARISQARYICKLDAHCAVDEGFDAKLIEGAAILGEDVTQIPAQYNLHAFDWVCDDCGKRTYQGPTPRSCVACGSTKLHRDILWLPRKSRLTTAWRFDSDLHFQYFREFEKRPEGKGEFPETMSCLGACFFMARERFWQLGGMDEQHGSWGQYGVELGCKSWLSGGRMVTNRRTFYAHCFRTQGQDFGFPYPLTSGQVENARARSRSLWLGNAWPGQRLPLSWLLERFWPVPGWSDEARAACAAAGHTFALAVAGRASPTGTAGRSVVVGADRGQWVPSQAVGAPSVVGAGASAAEHIFALRDEPQVCRVEATGPLAEVIDHDLAGAARDGPHEPGEHEPVAAVPSAGGVDQGIAVATTQAFPEPTLSLGVNFDPAKDPGQILTGETGDNEIVLGSHSEPPVQASNRLGASGVPAPPVPLIVPPPPGPIRSKGLVYYSDCRGDPAILEASRRQTLRCLNGHKLVSVTLEPIPFGRNIHFPAERGILTMFRQILAGLEAIEADVVFLVEHDMLYHPSHFDFTPPRKDTYYYNRHTWKVDAHGGQALHYLTDQTSGLCAWRDLLLEHYRARVARVEREGYNRNMGYEPGSHRYPRGVDDHPAAHWMSEWPNVDIRHDANLTRNRWRQDQFRNPNSCLGWTMADEVPGWGRTKGRFADFLREAT